MKNFLFHNFLLFILSLCLIVAGFPSFAQDSVVLMNGIISKGKIFKVDDDGVLLQETKKGKTKDYWLEKARVFSVIRENKEEVLYKHDTAFGNDRTEPEMRMFVYGQQDAWKGYKPWYVTGISAALSGVGTWALVDDKENGANFFFIVVPLATYLVMVGLVRAGITKSSVRDQAYLLDEDYREGYRRISKNKKNTHAMYGSVSGFVLGLGFALQQNSWKFPRGTPKQ